MENFKRKILFFIKENKWIIIASIIFLLWKFFLVGVLWHNRTSPPEPDDSYVYIGHIESVIQCPTLFCKNVIYPMTSFNGLSHLFYRLFFGYLALILRINSEQMYYWSFYIGSLILIPILIYFLKILTKNKNLVALSLLFLTLPNAGGTGYSFSWVTPGFFALLFFFLILAYFFNDKKKIFSYSLLFIPLGFFIHSIFIYFIMIFIFIAIWTFLLEKRMPVLLYRKAIAIIATMIIVYIPFSLYLSKVSNGSVYGPENFVSESVNNMLKKDGNINFTANDPTKEKYNSQEKKQSEIISKRFFPGFSKIYNNYLKWFIFNLWIFPLFIFLSFILFRFKQYKILGIYLGSLSFTIVSSIHQFGSRSLIFLWPMSFVFYSWGFWFSWIFIKEKYSGKKLLLSKAILSSFCLIIIIANLSFSFFWNSYSNNKKDYHIDNSYSDFLKQNLKKGEKISYLSPTVNTLIIKDNLKNTLKTSSLNKATYFISLNEEDINKSYKDSALNNFLNIFSKLSSIRREFNPKQSDKDIQSQKLPKIVKDEYTLVKDAGDLKIYLNNQIR